MAPRSSRLGATVAAGTADQVCAADVVFDDRQGYDAVCHPQHKKKSTTVASSESTATVTATAAATVENRSSCSAYMDKAGANYSYIRDEHCCFNGEAPGAVGLFWCARRPKRPRAPPKRLVRARRRALHPRLDRVLRCRRHRWRRGNGASRRHGAARQLLASRSKRHLDAGLGCVSDPKKRR